MGVILNRPTGKRLGDLDKQFQVVDFAGVPVFEGGPVEKEKLIVAGWEWLDSPSSFKLYFGIDLEKAKFLRDENPNIKLACFLGHSGWSPGQLESELDDDAWLTHSLDYDLFTNMDKENHIWKKIVGSMSDELRLLADAPDNPEKLRTICSLSRVSVKFFSILFVHNPLASVLLTSSYLIPSERTSVCSRETNPMLSNHP